MVELYERSASELARLIQEKACSSKDVVQAHIDRIAEVNEQVNAITVVLDESALVAAEEADSSAPAGPLHGVPFTVKENIDCLGSATTNGVPALENALPGADSPIVERMKSAGAIPIARTNLPELALRLSTSNPLRGSTLNPWNKALTPGGSSGGDAVALATGMTPFGLGNDIGGSLRNPAYCCGITALKPTVGRIPSATSMEPSDPGFAGQYMAVQGPMARRVEDLKLGLSILAGRDSRDPRSVDVPITGLPAKPKHAGLVTNLASGTIPDETVREIERAGRILENNGWTVEEVDPPEIERINEIWCYVFSTDFSVLAPAIQPFIEEPLYQFIVKFCERFDPARISNYLIHSERSRLARTWSTLFDEMPVIIGPTWCNTPWPVDADMHPETGIDTFLESLRFITPGNVLGFPSVALPIGLNKTGLPTGIQIYADLWREDLCLQVGGLLEKEATITAPINPV